MMVMLGIQLRQWQRILRRRMASPRFCAISQAVGLTAAGFALSAASLAHHAQPLTLALVCSLSGWPAIFLAGGGMLGYWLLWGQAGGQCVLWLCAALIPALLIGSRAFARENVWLMPALAGLIVAGVGLACQIWLGDDTPVGMYMLRVALAILGTRLAARIQENREPVALWIACGVAVLALAQLRPIPYLGFGYIAAGILAAIGTFPAAALAGLALDLSQITPVPMTAVLCLAYLARLIPGAPAHALCAAPAMSCALVMVLTGTTDLQPIPALLVGGFASLLIPRTTEIFRRRGETGFAQVRLEMAAGVMQQAGDLLMLEQPYPIDEQALIARAADRACNGCSHRKNCREDPKSLPTALLHKPLGNGADLPLSCRKSGRLLQELRHSQEHLRLIRADRDRREEYRSAVSQQYGFMAAYLQQLSDALSRRSDPPKVRFQPEIAICSASRDAQNGDRCECFAGVECRYYLLLCDGMGTGAEAAREGKFAAGFLKDLLCAGFPAQYALESLNSFFTLQGRAGAASVDLAEIHLDTGKATLYKWGAAPSFLLHKGEPIKIGTATAPPGLSILASRGTAQQLSLARGEMLILLSDGAGGEEDLRRALEGTGGSPGDLAGRILSGSRQSGVDDATVAVVRLGSADLTA